MSKQLNFLWYLTRPKEGLLMVEIEIKINVIFFLLTEKITVLRMYEKKWWIEKQPLKLIIIIKKQFVKRSRNIVLVLFTPFLL